MIFVKGYVHSFESLAALDGEGVRYGVFLKGCPLRCVYCHNPDTWHGEGVETDAEELVRKVSRYKPYFGEKGGVTFSGGEPLLQADFLCECVPTLEKEGISYVVDTSGAVELSHKVKLVLDKAQLVILDLKFSDNDSYLRYTGQSMGRVLETLEYLEKRQKRTWIRTVVVPKMNDTEADIEKYVELIKNLKCVEKYELLGFHSMGFSKYETLNIKNPLEGTLDLEKSVLERLQRFADEKMNK